MRQELDQRLRTALDSWRSDSRAEFGGPQLAATKAAVRAAMLASAGAKGADRSQRRQAREWRLGWSTALTGVAALVVAGAASTAAVGWNAPAGSPLHFVRLTQERVRLSMPGADRPAIELSLAEDRLREARPGHAADSLREAASLLAEARRALANDQQVSLAGRLENDEAALRDEETQQAPSSDVGGNGIPTSPPGGSKSGGAATPPPAEPSRANAAADPGEADAPASPTSPASTAPPSVQPAPSPAASSTQASAPEPSPAEWESPAPADPSSSPSPPG